MNNTITAAKGFLAAGVKCGIKQSGAEDLGLIVCPGGATAAAVFTTNKITAAPVQVCKEHLKFRTTEAVVVNSGNANCCTGKAGLKDARQMCEQVAAMLETPPNKVLVASTGIIGHKLPMRNVKIGIETAFDQLKADPESGMDFSRAIMTTDTKPKTAIRKMKIGKSEITIGGTAKGAGMIGPNMATTLCFITSDAAISRTLLNKALREAIGNSLNRLTVDGHQSTNDTAIALSSGMAGNSIIKKADSNYIKFSKALVDLCDDLAKQMALDAEGAKKMFTVIVNKAKNKFEAAKAARAVADYDLVKCAVHGNDPNWGRIICAVGSCGVDLNPEKLTCKIGNIAVFRNGTPVKFDKQKVCEIIAKENHIIEVSLGVGKASDKCYGCELSREYVTINADYHT